MPRMQELPVAKLKRKHYLDSKFLRLAERCVDLELPLELTDIVLVIDKSGIHYQCNIGTFIKSESEPFCPRQHKVCNFYIIIRRGIIDYKITSRDLRLELLRMKGVLK